jgi:hypothetical protein
MFASDLIKSAKKSIILIDNYVNDDTIQLLSKSNCNIIIYTDKPNNISKIVLEKYERQYKQKIEIKSFKKSHDRFLIIDNKELYQL